MLKGVVALVTGGASGLGRATVERVIREGGRAIICDLPTSKGAKVAEEIGSDVIFAPTDVSSPTDVENALAMCKDKFGRLDATVNCAGVAIAIRICNFNKGSAHDMTNFIRIQNVNLYGTFNVIRLSVGLMAENEPNADGQRGVIVNTAGAPATDGQGGQVAFAASKAAVVAMTLPIARDLSSMGIRVCTISPGVFSTPLITSIPEDIQKFLTVCVQHPKRLGDADEYAQMVQTIITNPLMNGEVIRLDGALRLPHLII